VEIIHQEWCMDVVEITVIDCIFFFVMQGLLTLLLSQKRCGLSIRFHNDEDLSNTANAELFECYDGICLNTMITSKKVFSVAGIPVLYIACFIRQKKGKSM
jgi:hypothetical protein